MAGLARAGNLDAVAHKPEFGAQLCVFLQCGQVVIYTVPKKARRAPRAARISLETLIKSAGGSLSRHLDSTRQSASSPGRYSVASPLDETPSVPRVRDCWGLRR